jgi:hypothetical protein
MPMSGRFLKNLPKLSLSFGLPAIVLLNLLQPCLRASSAVSLARFCASASHAPITLPVIVSSLHGTTLRHYRLGGILGRVHRRERWWARCTSSKAAKAEAVRIGRVFFCETNPNLRLERSQSLEPPWKLGASSSSATTVAGPRGAPRCHFRSASSFRD